MCPTRIQGLVAQNHVSGNFITLVAHPQQTKLVFLRHLNREISAALLPRLASGEGAIPEHKLTLHPIGVGDLKLSMALPWLLKQDSAGFHGLAAEA